MSDNVTLPLSSDRRVKVETSLSTFEVIVTAVALGVFLGSMIGLNAKLGRIADALERAHPAIVEALDEN